MIMLPLANKKVLLLQILLFICVSLAFGWLVIKDFYDPLMGVGDEEQWEYVGFYLAKNIKFTPLLQLNLVNNQVGYPYGTNSVFQPWGFERDIFYAIAYSFFGMGPWIQIYYFTSVLVTAIGTFFLLLPDYGLVRSSGAGFLVSFFNFYAIHKYPHHLSISVVHWTVLSVIADFLIVKRVTLKQRVSLRFILVRACFLVLSLSQELGYIAGFALMSFTISITFIAAILSYRYFNAKQKFIKLFQDAVLSYRSEFLAYAFISLFLLGIFVIATYIYLPLVFQIAREAKSFDFTGVPKGAWWTHPLRLLIPYLPGLNPGLPFFEKLFEDLPEGLGAGSPGLFLLILGAVGLWQERKQITIFIPLLTVFLLCLFYNPEEFATLKIFPWFSFNRVGGRVTVIYPVILVLFSLGISFDKLRLPRRRLLCGLLISLACVELYTSYSFKQAYQPYSLNKNFLTYMNYVKNQPGEAVLDWPFCVSGGNGVGALEGFCPYFNLYSIHAMRRFHEKKVIGQNFGRLHPSQVEPYIQAGWTQLFVPDNPGLLKGSHQSRCFNSQEWSFFKDFYTLNDFAGINLYVDILPENCANEFYKHFGRPAVETKLPSLTRVVFIPKSQEMKNNVNPVLGVSLKFKPILELSESDLIQNIKPSSLKLSGLNEIDKDALGKNIGRWAFGPESKLEFNLSATQLLELGIKFNTPIDNQKVEIEINGEKVDKIANIKNGEMIERHLKFKGIKGSNTVIFRYEDWNQHKTAFAPKDKRSFAIYFTDLAIKNLE